MQGKNDDETRSNQDTCRKVAGILTVRDAGRLLDQIGTR